MSNWNHKDYVTKPFYTDDTRYKRLNGTTFEVLGEQQEGVDEEVKPMWKIRFSNCEEITAYSDEIFDKASLMKIGDELEKLVKTERAKELCKEISDVLSDVLKEGFQIWICEKDDGDAISIPKSVEYNEDDDKIYINAEYADDNLNG